LPRYVKKKSSKPHSSPLRALPRRAPPSASDLLHHRLLSIIDHFPSITITVLADLVADEFVFGEITRVSREAPVLILAHRERTVVPGGGANAIYNLAALGVNVLPLGVVGDDEPGHLLLQRFRQKHIPDSGIVRLPGHATVTKTRILAGQAHTNRQQVVRIDREPEAPPSGSSLRRLANEARGYLRASDALLISDYGYGSASPEVWNAIRANRRTNGMPVTLDSRYRMFAFDGITAATPNEPEIEAALQMRIGADSDRLMQAGRTVLDRMGLDALVITRGRDGMVVFSRDDAPVLIAIRGSDQVTDVTGAGDTVIAAFTAALAAGASPADAAHLANYAAGIVVMKRGTATVSAEELKVAISSTHT
jgi:rfaE bifunctional protein kinase chain/domain